jgi:SAM-dependent methyltransferase
MQQPFDTLANTYDLDFSASPLARHLRARVHARLQAAFPPGTHTLELGCGTGDDALFMAQQGVHVLATDSSPQMLNATRRKTQHNANVTVAPLDLQALPQGFAHEWSLFDGVYSNFGPLNCLTDWRLLAEWLAARMPAGGRALFGVMAPFCLWEVAWHAAHAEFRVAFRRLGRSSFQPAYETGIIPIAYPSVRRLSADFAPYFRRVNVYPLGLLLPPSDVYGVIERRPLWLRRLIRWDDRLSRYGVLSNFADHYWIEFVRR